MLPPRLLLKKHRQAGAGDLPRPLKGTRLNSVDCGNTMTDRGPGWWVWRVYRATEDLTASRAAGDGTLLEWRHVHLYGRYRGSSKP
jgi:hypothetical protein